MLLLNLVNKHIRTEAQKLFAKKLHSFQTHLTPTVEIKHTFQNHTKPFNNIKKCNTKFSSFKMHVATFLSVLN